MIQEFFKYLDKETNVHELEQWIYKQTELEKKIGKENYQFLLEFNYKKKYAQIEIQDFILKNIISEKEYAKWKMEKLLSSANIEFPKDNLYSYVKQNPNLLEGKTLTFAQFRSEKEMEIKFAEEISQFVRHVSELQKGNEKYLYLGTYENSYIHLVVNKKNEIWLAYDVINKEDYFAPNIHEAILKLILGDKY